MLKYASLTFYIAVLITTNTFEFPAMHCRLSDVGESFPPGGSHLILRSQWLGSHTLRGVTHSSDIGKSDVVVCVNLLKSCFSWWAINYMLVKRFLWERRWRKVTKIDFLIDFFPCLPRTRKCVCEYYNETLSGITFSAGLVSSLIARLPTLC